MSKEYVAFLLTESHFENCCDGYATYYGFARGAGYARIS